MKEYLLEYNTGTKVFYTIVFIVVVMFITETIKNIIYKRTEEKSKYYTIKQKINLFTGLFLGVCVILFWMDSASNLTTYIGLLSAGIAIALKEIFVNIAGWIYIEFRKPFEVGHRIKIGKDKGDVIDKRLFQFSIVEVSSEEEGEQSTGKIVDIPNSFAFMYSITNFTKGFEYVWNEVKVLLTPDSDWREAKELLLDIVNRDTSFTTEEVSNQIRNASRKYMIHYNKLTPIIYTEVKENGIQLSIRYLCDPKSKRNTVNAIWEDILVEVEIRENINLKYN